METFILKQLKNQPSFYACLDCGLQDLSGKVVRESDLINLLDELDSLKSQLKNLTHSEKS